MNILYCSLFYSIIISYYCTACTAFLDAFLNYITYICQAICRLYLNRCKAIVEEAKQLKDDVRDVAGGVREGMQLTKQDLQDGFRGSSKVGGF